MAAGMVSQRPEVGKGQLPGPASIAEISPTRRRGPTRRAPLPSGQVADFSALVPGLPVALPGGRRMTLGNSESRHEGGQGDEAGRASRLPDVGRNSLDRGAG